MRLHNPTIISPVPYRNRFLDAMQRYFVGIEAPLIRRVSHSNTPGPSVLDTTITRAFRSNTIQPPRSGSDDLDAHLHRRSESSQSADMSVLTMPSMMLRTSGVLTGEDKPDSLEMKPPPPRNHSR